MSKRTLAITFFILVLSTSRSLQGQAGLAGITGTISDPSGAVVPNAPVEVRNLATGQVSTAASTTTGNFTVSQLPIGDYSLTVEVTGFKRFIHENFHLESAQIMRENVSLQVGQASESVTVTADASLLKTESSAVVQNVTLSQLDNLPILTVGSTGSGFRDPYASTRLVPGVRFNGGSNAASGTPGVTTTMSINGTPDNTYGTRLDGMTMNPTGPRLIGATMQTQPSVDALEEVSIMTSNFAAEFGAAGGAMINMQTKSGTNAYHGSAYDYGTNEALNSHQAYTGFRSKIRQNDFGGTFGGPVRIPKLYDGTNKTFFFFSMELFKQKNIQVSSVTVPIQPYRDGDFSFLIAAENRLITTSAGNALDSLGRTMQSGTIFDPQTQRAVPGKLDVRDPFLGNKFPLSRYDPISAKVLALIPKPLGANFDKGLLTNNYTGSYDTSRTSKIPSIKLDQNIGAKGRVSFYLQETNTRSPRSPAGAEAYPDLITGGVTTFSSGTTVRLNYDYTISPRLLLHVGAGWNDSDFRLEAPVTNFNQLTELGLKGATVQGYFPRITASPAAIPTAVGGVTAFGTYQPTASFERRPSGILSANYVTGGHTFKVGMDYRIEKFPNYVNSNVGGTYTFGANYTEQPSLQGVSGTTGFDGFEFASFLLGGMSANTLAQPTALANIKSQTGLYLQDTWKLTRKLTLDYGVRWDYGTYAAEQYGRNGSTGLAVPNPSASGRPGGLQFEAVCKCNFAANYPYAIGPRLGLAYQIDSKTVLRAGLGVVYNSTSTASGSSTSSASSGSLPGNSGQITGLFKDGMPAEVKPQWPVFEANVGQGVGTVVAMPALLDRNAGRPARLTQWNLALQREITRNLVVEASYVGNRGTWWTASGATQASGLATLNTLSIAKLRSLGFNDFTSATEAGYLTALVSSLPGNTAIRTALAARGITGLPYANFPTTQNVRQSLRDYPQYNSNGLNAAPLGNTWYDAFQLNVTQRFSHGVSFNMNYNFSKNLDLMSSPDPFNRAIGKDLASNDLPHQMRLTLQYQVPELRKSGMAFVSNRFVSYALSGWGIGAYLSYQSGTQLARPTSQGTLPISQFLGYGPGSAQLKKDANGNDMNPWSVDWTDYDGVHHTDPIDVNCHCFDPTKTVALNKDAWESIPNGQFGAQQSTIRNFRGMRIPTENANFSRNFRLTEGIVLNVRAEFNNIFNRMAMPSPTTGGNFTADPLKFQTGAQTGLYTSGFGTFSVLNGLGGQRTGTFVGRLTF